MDLVQAAGSDTVQRCNDCQAYEAFIFLFIVLPGRARFALAVSRDAQNAMFSAWIRRRFSIDPTCPVDNRSSE
jgi:hypothetical protein